MSLEAITIVVEPPRVALPGLSPTSEVRRFHEFDRFAAALASHTRAPVAVVEALLRDAPARGALLVHSTDFRMLDECDPATRAQTAARTLILNGGRATLVDWLERYGFAGGVTEQRYAAWRANPAGDRAAGLYGLRPAAARMGARCGPGGSERYCVMASDRFTDLPSLLVGYLEAMS